MRETFGEGDHTLRFYFSVLATSKPLSREREVALAARIAEIAAELDLPAERVLEAVLSAREVCSLDDPLGGEQECSPYTLLADTSQGAPDADLCRAEAREVLNHVIGGLNHRELLIIRLYYGLDGNEAQTLDQIGRLLHLTRERVRQLREQALEKLRHPTRARVLLGVIGDFQEAQGGLR